MRCAATIMLLLAAPPPGSPAHSPPPAPPAPPPPAVAPERERGLLAGPQVQPQEDTDAPGMVFGERLRPGRPGRGPEARRWMEALGAIDASPEQRRQILAIVAELRQVRRAFAETMSDPAAAPNVDVYRQRIWDLLDPAQQKALRETLASMSAEAAVDVPGKARRRLEFLESHRKGKTNQVSFSR